jgi:hypothetical protein
MAKLTWWMRVVGSLYVLQFVAMAFARAPIRSFGPEGALDRAAAGDPVAGFLVDTWVTFGLEVGAIGIVLLVFAGRPGDARALVWTVLAIELIRGIVNDLWFIARGIEVAGYSVWIMIHLVIIVTGLWSLRAASAIPSAGSSAVSAELDS